MLNVQSCKVTVHVNLETDVQFKLLRETEFSGRMCTLGKGQEHNNGSTRRILSFSLSLSRKCQNDSEKSRRCRERRSGVSVTGTESRKRESFKLFEISVIPDGTGKRRCGFLAVIHFIALIHLYITYYIPNL